MRIVSGLYKGRTILAPKTRDTRPTTDKAREAIFNILLHAPWAPRLEGKRVIDVFAGSGGLGLEALSRGAGFCLFVENTASARGAIRANIEAFGVCDQARLQRRDASRLGKITANVGGCFEFAFLDPPYGKNLLIPALKSLAWGGWLSDKAVVMVEAASDEIFESWPEGFTPQDTRIIGASQYVFLEYNQA